MVPEALEYIDWRLPGPIVNDSCPSMSASLSKKVKRRVVARNKEIQEIMTYEQPNVDKREISRN